MNFIKFQRQEFAARRFDILAVQVEQTAFRRHEE